MGTFCPATPIQLRRMRPSLISQAATNPPMAAPAVNPHPMTISAVIRTFFGLYSPTSAMALGIMPPKPIPAMNRMASS